MAKKPTYEELAQRVKKLEKEAAELKRAEEELEYKKRHLEALVEYSSLAIVTLDEGHNIISCNRDFEKLFHFKESEIVGRNLDEIIVGQEYIEDAISYTKITLKGKAIRRSGKRQRKDGTCIDVEFTGVPVIIDGKVIGAYGIYQDISGHKRAEEAMREAEERYRVIFEQAADSIVLIDAETGALVEFNGMAHENLGYTREEFEKLKISDFEVIESAEKVVKHIKKIVKKGFDHFETKHKTKGGELRDIYVSSKVLSIRGRDFIQSIWRDITDRKRAEDELRKSKENLDKAQKVAHIGNWSRDLNLNRAEWSDEIYRIFALTPGDRTGVPFEHVLSRIHPEDREYVTSVLKEAVEKKQAFDFEYRTVPIEGSEKIIRVRGEIEYDETGKPVRFFGTDQDITEYKQMEEELQKSRSQLRDLSTYLQSAREQERTSIAREIHDDLGQVLTALKMDLSWMGKRFPKDQKPLIEKKKSMLKILDEAIKTVKRIITDLRPSLLDDLGLIPAIEWQAEDFQARTEIKCKFSQDLETITVDKELSTALFRIVQEGLTNIARHASATNINISLTEKASELVLEVRDNGKGITNEQISNPKSFGLIGMRERALVLGGKMEIKWVKGKGTTLTVSIPVEENEK